MFYIEIYLFLSFFLKDRIQNRIHFFSTRVNNLRNENLQSHTSGQYTTGSPNIHDPPGLRLTIDGRYNAVNERQNIFNGQNLVNDHNSVNEYQTSINNHQTPCKINNGIAMSQIKIWNTEQSELNNNGLINNKSEKTDRSNHRQNGYPKNHQNNIDHKNDLNRLANGKAINQEQFQNDTFNITTNLRQLLRPTVIEKRQESAKAEYDTEDINGPYNFRQLLRPTEYLPTESLRKRKGGIVSNGVSLPKDKVPEKHVKRRAPLAPTQNKSMIANK